VKSTARFLWGGSHGAGENRQIGIDESQEILLSLHHFVGSGEGDFRDWKDIEAWASNIAQGLETLQAQRFA